MEAVKAFLDANILFSAALGGPSFVLLWELAETKRVTLYTSEYCYIEAIENLKRKRAQALSHMTELMKHVSLVNEAKERLDWAREHIKEKDAPVLAAAADAKVDVLITGDLRDFGHLMNRKDQSPLVMTLRAFLLEWAF